MSGSLWQYYRDKPALNDAADINDFHDNNNNMFCLNLEKNNRSNR